MTSIAVVRRSTSGRQDKRVHASPGGVSCNTPIFASPCRWTNMSSPKIRPIEVPKGYLSNTKEISDGMLTNVKGVNGGSGWLAMEDQTWRRFIRSYHLGMTDDHHH